MSLLYTRWMNRKPARLWDFPSAALVLLVILTVDQRLMSTHWAAGLGSAVVLSLIGVILGLAIGFSQFQRGTVFWFSFGYSIAIVILVLGWILYPGVAWGDRVANLGYRLTQSLGLFLTGKPVKDTLMFVIFIALVFWSTGLLAGYALTRFGSFSGAAIPAGVVLVIIQLYVEGKTGNETLLAVYVLLSLFLLGRLNYVQRRTFWKEQRINLLYESRSDLHLTLVGVAIAIVILVWSIPTSAKSFAKIKSSWEQFTRPMRTVQENLGNAVSGLQSNQPAVPGEYYGNALGLGNQAATGDSVFFRIQTPPSDSTGRYYWRVRSYNIFLNDQWYSENVSAVPFIPGQEATIPVADPEGATGDFAITVVSADPGALITPARPVWISTPSQLVFQKVPGGKVDPIQFRSNTPIQPNEQYLVHAKLYEPTIAQLRAAGDVYPEWVTSNYLQLPDNISPDILTLANRITGRYTNAYDRANAITQYLRSSITYTTSVESPPAGQDPVDWFLFESKQGFCNYYATAEVLLLRDAGIPARMVVGFAEGELVAPDTYTVLSRDSHAWPEVYFPGVGWVEFEPTSSQAALVRPPGESANTPEPGGTATPGGVSGSIVPEQETPTPVVQNPASSGTETSVDWLMRLLLICALIVAILRLTPLGAFLESLEPDPGTGRRALPVALKQVLHDRGMTPPGWLLRWASLAELDPIERAFANVYRSLHWLGEKPVIAQTPAEAATILSEYLPEVSKEIQDLLDEYQRHLYSPRHGYLPLVRRAIKAIRKEARRVIIQRRWSAFSVIFRPGPK